MRSSLEHQRNLTEFAPLGRSDLAGSRCSQITRAGGSLVGPPPSPSNSSFAAPTSTAAAQAASHTSAYLLAAYLYLHVSPLSHIALLLPPCHFPPSPNISYPLRSTSPFSPSPDPTHSVERFLPLSFPHTLLAPPSPPPPPPRPASLPSPSPPRRPSRSCAGLRRRYLEACDAIEAALSPAWCPGPPAPALARRPRDGGWGRGFVGPRASRRAGPGCRDMGGGGSAPPVRAASPAPLLRLRLVRAPTLVRAASAPPQ
jgi:hypothetical protein